MSLVLNETLKCRKLTSAAFDVKYDNPEYNKVPLILFPPLLLGTVQKL